MSALMNATILSLQPSVCYPPPKLGIAFGSVVTPPEQTFAHTTPTMGAFDPSILLGLITVPSSIKRLLDMIRFVVQFAIRLLGVTLLRACLPRLPPRNYDAAASSEICCPRCLCATRKVERRYEKTIQTEISIPAIRTTSSYPATKDQATVPRSPCIEIRIHDSPLPITPRTQKIANLVENEFSIATPICSPSKAVYITPIRSLYNSTTESINLAVLKAASERVSEILREHRQKLDAGEDPCLMRKEARRKRAQELGLLGNAF